MVEIWKGIENHTGYEVSTLGRVRSKDRVNSYTNKGIPVNRVLKGCILKSSNAMGYDRVSLWKNNKAHEYKIHRLVAETFIPNPENKEQVNHKNGIKTDNRLENLEWMTRVENTLHSIDLGLAYLRFDKFDYMHMRLLHEQQVKISEIAKIFDAEHSHVKRIVTFQTHR